MKKNSFKLGTYAAMLVAGISVLALGGCEDEQLAPALPRRCAGERLAKMRQPAREGDHAARWQRANQRWRRRC